MSIFGAVSGLQRYISVLVVTNMALYITLPSRLIHTPLSPLHTWPLYLQAAAVPIYTNLKLFAPVSPSIACCLSRLPCPPDD
jgi:hypothetical protein